MPEPRDTTGESLDAWLARECARAADLLMRNVSPPGAMRGAIIASPSRSNPDYDYHWVRDSGIAVRAILELYSTSADPAARARYFGALMDFVDFSRHIQRTAVERGAGLGEPKFLVDGEPYPGPWARPQDDGPAIRAIELIHLAFVLLDEGKGDLVLEKLYDARLPTNSVIKADLEYVAHRVREPCYDCWEEVYGYSFFTQNLERKALLAGARLAIALGDVGAARFYVQQAHLLAGALRAHWDPERGILVATLGMTEGWMADRRTGLDSSVIVSTLGGYAVHEEHGAPLCQVEEEKVLATAAALEQVFEFLYPINSPYRGIPGIAVGRYPSDRYDGYERAEYGNPWPSLTIASAMYHYKVAERFRQLGEIAITPVNEQFFRMLRPDGAPLLPGDVLRPDHIQFHEVEAALRRRGDTFLERVRYHMNPDGSMSEQMNRVTGFQQGAPDLTMNYAAFLLAVEMRRAG